MSALESDRTPHSTHSVLREIILEHQFIGRLLQRLWQRRIHDVEVLRSEFDAGGYDLVVSRQDIIRHLQLKARVAGSKTRDISLGLKLGQQPSGCVLCFEVDDQLELKGYLWFGGRPHEKLPSLDGFPVTRHTKGDAEGVKLERPAHRKVPYSTFEQLADIDAVIEKLLGPL